MWRLRKGEDEALHSHVRDFPEAEGGGVTQINRGVLALALIAGLGLTAAAHDTKQPRRENFHLFLLAGQSNMAGRGEVAAEDRTPHPRVLMLSRAGTWVPAVEPMHFDKPAIVGVGPGRAFGVAVAEAMPGVTVGLIPAAVGGSPIDAWMPGAYDAATQTHPWDDAMARVARARQTGTLRGVLWHQGESDATSDRASTYPAKLQALVVRFRADLDAPALPFIAGQLGRFPQAPWDTWRVRIDEAHRALPTSVPHTAFVRSDGLHDKGDAVHFDAASARTLGRRYAEAYLAMIGAAVR